MSLARPIRVAESVIGSGDAPAVCVPLVSRDVQTLAAEAADAFSRRPDVLEWRVDYFDELADPARVAETLGAIRAAAPGVAVLYTRRSVAEGGERNPVAESRVVAGYDLVCRRRLVEIVDCEVSAVDTTWNAIREASRRSQVSMIGSFHDFSGTPGQDELLARFRMARQRGADIAKVAVMPRVPEDVLNLLGATLRATEELPIPVISMAMGPLGIVTRLFGHDFG